MNIEIPGDDIQLSSNPIWIKVTGAVIPAGASGFKILLRVVSLDGVIAGGPFIDDNPPDANGDALFDISGLIDIPLTPEFDHNPQSIVTHHPASALNIGLDVGYTCILNGEPVTVYQTENGTGTSLIALKGGVSDALVCEYLKPYQSFFIDWINTGKFLTNIPDGQVISPKQVVKLWYITAGIVAGSLQAKWNLDIQLGDSDAGHYQTSGDVDFVSFLDGGATGITEFSITEVLMAIPEALTYGYVKSFTFWISLRDDETEISERRTFVVDNNYYQDNNFLFAGNSFNCIDSWWLNGAVKSTIDVTGTEGVRSKGYSSDATLGTIVTTSKSGRRKWIINTGFKSAAEMEAMMDVYLSKNLWLLIDGKLVPVTLANGEKLISNSEEDLHDVDLELLEAHNRRFF